MGSSSMCELQWDPLAEIFFFNKRSSKEIYCLCSRVFIQKRTDNPKSNEPFNEISASDEDQTEPDKKPLESEPCDPKQEVDTEVISCYCSASHTDNVSTDEHDSLRDSHVTHSTTRGGLQSSDSGTDLNECLKHDNNLSWHKYWSVNGETIIWRSWISKYSAYINPDYLETERKEAEPKTHFSFDEKDVELAVNLSTIKENSLALPKGGTKRPDLTSRNRILVRNLSGSDSYDKLHGDFSEGWNPLSPASVEFEGEAERLLNSRCGSHASSSFRTQDSMTNVTHMSVSSVNLSSKSSDSFSSVSSVQSSLSSASSDDAEEPVEYDQQWNSLWQKHYEEEYLVQYKRFICSTGEVRKVSGSRRKDSLEDKTLCGDCHLINTKELDGIQNLMTSFTMESDVTLDPNAPSCSTAEIETDVTVDLETNPYEEELKSMGLPVSFGYDNTKKETTHGLKRSHDDSDTDDLSVQSNRIKAAMSLVGMVYTNKNNNLTGRVEYKKKNIRLQNRQLKFQITRPKHIYFDDDGNAMPEKSEQGNFQSSSDSLEFPQNYSSGEEEVEIEERLSPQTGEITDKTEGVTPKKRKRKKKPTLPAEIKDNPQLMKFWHRRYSLFSKYNLGIKLDKESWYSVTPEVIAKRTAERCKCDLIIDAFCGAGGNAIQFALTCQRVIAIDIDPAKVELARHNAEIYGVADRIEFIVGDFLELAPKLAADVIFLSPPWGGLSYSSAKNYDPEKNLQPVGFTELFRHASSVSRNVVIYLPKNTDMTTLVEVADGGKVEFEQNFTHRNLRAITAYYNELVSKL